MLHDPRLGIGGNKAPIAERLADEYEEVIASLDLLEERAAVAAEPNDDASLGVVSDLTKEVGTLLKRAETARTTEKEPFLAGGREVDAFFKPISERASKIKTALEKGATAYLRRKADEERAARQEEERRAREEAARKAREAAELERQSREAERAAAAEDAERIAADAERAREAADASRREAEAAAKAADAKAADHARTRGEKSTATLATFWNFEIVDLAAIPLDQLRPYIPRADIEKAIRAHIRIHKGAPIAGVRIFEDTQARVV